MLSAYPNGDDRNELAVLARRVRNLTIDRRDPEWFHEEKSEVAHVLMQIARRAGFMKGNYLVVLEHLTWQRLTFQI